MVKNDKRESCGLAASISENGGRGMRMYLGLALMASLIPGALCGQQVEARQATPEETGQVEAVEVASPMLLEISLGASGEGKSLVDPSVKGRTYYDTKKFVCDKARVPKLLVMKRQNRKGGTDLEVTPTLTSGWPRQDIDLTVALVSAGKEIQKKTWDDLTVGADDSTANKLTALSPVAGFAGSSTKFPSVVFSFKPGEFEALFQGEEAPRLRLILDIQE